MTDDTRNPVTARWEDGIEHDPRSIEIYKSIAKLDLEVGGDYFCFKSGGDGDNGEHLMYLLDIHFEKEDGEPEIGEISDSFVMFWTGPNGYIFPAIYRKAEEFMKAAKVTQTRIQGNNDHEWVRFHFEPSLTLEQAEELEEKFGVQ